MTNQPDFAPDSPTGEPEPQSLTELFHLVKSLVPAGQEIISIAPSSPVAQALEIMDRENYSQLPVVAGNFVLGVVSYRSVARKLLKLDAGQGGLENLPIDEFMEELKYAQPLDNWVSILDHLDSQDAVLVGQRNGLRGIVTSMDVLHYLHRIANPFVLLAEIELSLRRIIRACVTDDELETCIQNSLKGGRMFKKFNRMSFYQYIQIISDPQNWPHFEVVFGEGEWQRKQTAQRLDETRRLRNEAFHFTRQFTDEDHDKLAQHRRWLQMKATTYEGLKAAREAKTKAVQVEPVKPKATRRARPGRWNEKSFMDALEKESGAASVPTAKAILEWARGRGTAIQWGTGKQSGSFVPNIEANGFTHQLFAVYTYGSLEVYFQYYQYKPPFDSEEKRLELLAKLNAIDGVDIPADGITRRPSIPLEVLADDEVRRRYLSVLDWVIEEIRAA